MPDETHTRAKTEPSAKPWRTAAIILGILCLVLGVSFFKQRTALIAGAEASDKLTQSTSNQLARLRTELALDHSTSAQSQSNLQSALDRRIGEWIALSNRQVQSGVLLSNAQQETQIALSNLQVKTGATIAVESQRDELARRLEPLLSVDKELTETRERLKRTLIERATTEEALGRERVANADLRRKLEDLPFLQLQVKRLEAEAAWRKKQITAVSTNTADAEEIKDAPTRGATWLTIFNKSTNGIDPNIVLELQPDGTVRKVTPANQPPGK